jgi:hypothetical protein
MLLDWARKVGTKDKAPHKTNGTTNGTTNGSGSLERGAH